MGIIIAMAMGIVVLLIIIWIISTTYYSIGNFGFFNGGKAKFSGIADSKFKSNEVSLKNCKNLNGSTRIILKVKKGNKYNITCNVKAEKGNAILTLKDTNNNSIATCVNEDIKEFEYESNYNDIIFVYIEIDKFYGEITCKIL